MSSFISYEQFKKMRTAFSENKDKIIEPAYRNAELLAFSETFDAKQVLKLLNLPGCTSLRVHYGMDEELKIHAILTAVDEAGKDILPQDVANEEFIIEDGTRCPPFCPPQ